jgi:predicted lipoprotein with Yx(FWY)xxD motif
MSHSPSRRAGVAALLLAAPLALSGCGTAQNSVPASLAVPVGNGASLDGTSTPSRNGISTSVTFVGTVMTSGGFTLYRYAKDRATPPTSACTGPCAASWPPIAADEQPDLDVGIDPKLLGSVVRPDGSKQLTVAGWPVYRYIQDTAPGFVNGQGVGGLWQAVGANGKPLATPATPSASPAPQEVPAKTAPAPSSAPVKAPAVAPKAVPSVPAVASRAPKVVTKAPVAPPTTVVRDAPGTSSTD